MLLITGVWVCEQEVFLNVKNVDGAALLQHHLLLPGVCTAYVRIQVKPIEAAVILASQHKEDWLMVRQLIIQTVVEGECYVFVEGPEAIYICYFVCLGSCLPLLDVFWLHFTSFEKK